MSEKNIFEPLGDLWTDIGINNLHNEGSVSFRNGKKPLKLFKRLINIGSNDGDIIMDSFAGSGTTGHSVIDINKNDGCRKYILIELEKEVCLQKTQIRIKNVYNENNSQLEIETGMYNNKNGFKYCVLDKPIFDEYGNINPEVKFNDLAYHIFFSETGTPLSQKAKIGKSPLVGIFKDNAYYLLYNGILGDKSINGGNILTSKILESLPEHNGPKIIFGEGCRLSQAKLKRENIIFKQMPYELKIS